MGTGVPRDETMRYEGEDLKARRKKRLQQATKLRLAAERRLLTKQQEENNILLLASSKGFSFGSLDATTALALAKAAHEALEAEGEVAQLRVAECKKMLDTLLDVVDDVAARIDDASYQIGVVLEAIEDERIHEVPVLPSTSSPQPRPMAPAIGFTSLSTAAGSSESDFGSDQFGLAGFVSNRSESDSTNVIEPGDSSSLKS